MKFEALVGCSAAIAAAASLIGFAFMKFLF
jgi:hypothetical protein